MSQPIQPETQPETQPEDELNETSLDAVSGGAAVQERLQVKRRLAGGDDDDLDDLEVER